MYINLKSFFSKSNIVNSYPNIIIKLWALKNSFTLINYYIFILFFSFINKCWIYFIIKNLKNYFVEMNFDKSLERSEKFNLDFSKYDELEIEKSLKDLLETVYLFIVLQFILDF